MNVEIHDIAFGGKGVGRIDGLVVFVPFTIPGEKVEVAVTRRKKKFAEARLLSVETPSPDRVEPPCPYFGRCGGCAYQHIGYEAQLAIKGAQVEQTLRRLGRLSEPVPMQPVIPSPSPYGYRNRIRVHAAGGVVGFYAHEANTLLDIEACPIAAPEVNARLSELRSRPLMEGDYTVAREAPAFFEQTNDAVAAALLERVGGLITPGGRLVDAYCGAGFFSRHLRERYERVIGIEENDFAIAHARSLALPHETYLTGDVAEHLPAALAGGGDTTSVILDPPAAGVAAPVLDALLAALPREILYVSCNPATLGRDLGTLCPAYRLAEVTPLDMFPQTAEIEVVAHLRRA